ncbi:hypothetical protein HOQ51_gp38 [uncultured phage_MedDCM-OCT-S35-C6]|nr:hypothetical protein HOQ51_gp38 [uncultured phage_MedDCM-OCT-S35-C6]
MCISLSISLSIYQRLTISILLIVHI